MSCILRCTLSYADLPVSFTVGHSSASYLTPVFIFVLMWPSDTLVRRTEFRLRSMSTVQHTGKPYDI